MQTAQCQQQIDKVEHLAAKESHTEFPSGVVGDQKQEFKRKVNIGLTFTRNKTPS